MTWFRVDDSFYDHPRVQAIPRKIRPAAIGLWTLAGSYIARHLGDGYIAAATVGDLGGTKPLVDALVGVGLWELKDDGYLFHDWTEYQPTRAQVMADREASRLRQAAARERRMAQRERERLERERAEREGDQ